MNAPIDCEVGDRLQAIRDHLDSFDTDEKGAKIVHARTGDIFTVIKTDGTVIFDWCRCLGKATGHRDHFAWWVSSDLFVNIGPKISEEEAAKAISLPDPVDVAAFFGVKP